MEQTAICQPSDSESASETTSNSEALSIYELVRRHSRSRIIVEPTLWTNVHLELLQCSFCGPFPAPPVTMKLDYPTDARNQRIFKSDFRNDYGFSIREDAVQCLLGSQRPLKLVHGLWFWLGETRSIWLPCRYFCLTDECKGGNVGSGFPVVAYNDYRHITWLRKDKIRQQCLGRRYTHVNKRLGKIRLRKLVPKEPLHDPYLVALLIALAQRQWAVLEPSISEQVSGVKSKVLCTPKKGDFLHLYSANVSSALINMFEDPNLRPPAPQSLSIRITAIPYEPIETLRDRIMASVLSATSLEDAGKSDEFILYK